MGISVFDVNTAIEGDSELSNIAGKTIIPFPVVATANESAPFVIYLYQPRVPDVEQYWLRCDLVRYSIFDTDAERLFNITERFLELLTVGENHTIASNSARILSTYQTGSSLATPIEKEGWYRMNLDFKIMNVDN
jgi:hypothetical protein